MVTKKSEKQLNVSIPISLDKELERHCFENEQKKKEVVEKALVHFLWEQPQKEVIEN